MKKTAIALIGCFFAVTFFATAHSSEHEYRYDDDRYEYREGREHHDDDRGGSERHDDDRYEYRGSNERYSDDRHEYRNGHDSDEHRRGNERHDDDRYEQIGRAHV